MNDPTGNFPRYAVMALGAIWLGLAGCSQPGPAQSGDQGILFRGANGEACGIASWDIAVHSDGPDGTPGTADDYDELINTAPTGYGDVTGLDLPPVDDPSDTDPPFDPTGYVTYGDHFFALPPGDYDVTITALDAGATPITAPPLNANPQTQTAITVLSGQTTEIGFYYECDGTSIGGLDVFVIVNEGPDITDHDYYKFLHPCETSGPITTTFGADPGDVLKVTWDIYGPRPAPATMGSLLTTVGPEILNVPASGTTQATLNYAFPPDGTYDVIVTVTNSAGQATQFQFPMHIIPPALGSCVDTSAGFAWGSEPQVAFDDPTVVGTTLTIGSATFSDASLQWTLNSIATVGGRESYGDITAEEDIDGDRIADQTSFYNLGFGVDTVTTYPFEVFDASTWIMPAGATIDFAAFDDAGADVFTGFIDEKAKMVFDPDRSIHALQVPVGSTTLSGGGKNTAAYNIDERKTYYAITDCADTWTMLDPKCVEAYMTPMQPCTDLCPPQ